MQYLSAILSHEIWTWETWKRVNALEDLPPTPVYTGYSVGPFQNTYGHMVQKNTLLDGKRLSVTLKTKDFSFLNDVISLFFLPSASLAIQLGDFCIMWPYSASAPILREKLTRHHRETFDKKWH